MIRMVVRDLTNDPAGDRAVLCLEDVERRLRVALLIPMNEANRLARVLGFTPCPCVPVFELIESLLARFGAGLRRVVLNGDDAGISGTLCIAGGEGEIAVSCHAADALALATRAGVPVYAVDGVLRHAHPVEASAAREDAAELLRWLEQVTPADFEGPGPPPSAG
jgi:bifunctional DNase/RNase